MNSRTAVALFVLASFTYAPNLSIAQTSSQSSEANRKLVSHVTPQYPSLARSMNLKGTVKLLVLVDTSGSPKTIEVKGGNPVLVQAAEKALHDWKWEPAPHATSEVIDLRFDPH